MTIRDSIFISIFLLLLFGLESVSHANSPEGGGLVSRFKVAAVVNDEMISTDDVMQRVNMVIATTGMNDSEVTRKELLPQTVQALINESLQISAARQVGIDVSSQEIDAAIANIEQRRGQPPGSLLTYFATRSIDGNTFKNQLRAQLAWRKFVGRRLASDASVSNAEVMQEIDHIKRSGSKIEEVLISVITLPVHSVDSVEKIQNSANRVVGELRGGANFATIATQLSQSGAGSINMKWFDVSKIEPSVAANLINMSENSISNPIKTARGYEIIKLHKRRTGKRLQDAELLFKQIVLTLDNDAGSQEVDVLMDIARHIGKYPGPCSKKGVAGVVELEGLGIDVDYVPTRYSQMSPEILPLVRNLGVQDISEPFATPDGIRLLMLCEKTELPFTEEDKIKVRNEMISEKLELQAVKHLRKLRREAYVDIRL